MTTVAIVKGHAPSRMVQRALQLIGADALVASDDRVLVKPNYVSAKHPSTGITTDSRVGEAVVAFLKRRGVNDLVVGEGGAGDTDRAFDVVGIREVAARHRVPLVNLNRDARVTLRVPQPLALQEVGIARTALERTGIVNVPKLKVHHMATVTLCMKNLMGVILPKNMMHGRIHEKIVDLASLFADKVKLNVVDALVGADRDETHGRPVPMNLVIAGQDMVAVDTVATRVMGLDPGTVRYLALAEDRGLGVATLDRIDVLGEPIDDVMKRFSV
jgi:uncharacterized protein (DUF362 family)